MGCLKCDENSNTYLNHGHCTSENQNYDTTLQAAQANYDDDCLR